MNDIKARMKSVRSTMQITKAMELVATSKLRRAKESVERTRPFYNVLMDSIRAVFAAAEGECELLKPRADGKTLYVVIAGDRGLAGGYNANAFRLCRSLLKDGEEAEYIPLGKKALEYYNHRGLPVVNDGYPSVSAMSVGCAMELGGFVSEAFLSGKYSRVMLIYTEFVSMMTQTPRAVQLFPLEIDSTATASAPELEEDPEELIRRILPAYIGGIIHSAVCESLASESGARRTAMNSANKNAEEMIDTLMLSFNRARQAVITQEITEIVSGAEAL